VTTPLYTLTRSLGCLQSRSGCIREESGHCHESNRGSSCVQPVAYSLYRVHLPGSYVLEVLCFLQIFSLVSYKVFPVCFREFRNLLLLGALYLTTLLQFMHRAQFHKHVYDFCSWLIEHTRRRRLWTLCQPDTNRVGVWCVTLGRETLVNWITSHVAFVTVQRTRFLGMPHASRGPFATHTPHELSRTFYSHICAFCCVWVPDVDNDCTGVSFQNLLQTQDCISSL
jgi:hypothetical protein